MRRRPASSTAPPRRAAPAAPRSASRGRACGPRPGPPGRVRRGAWRRPGGSPGARRRPGLRSPRRGRGGRRAPAGAWGRRPRPTARRPRPRSPVSRRASPLPQVLVELAELEVPAAAVAVGVALLLVVRAGEIPEAALDDRQPGRVALGAEAELHQRRVVL